MNDCFACDLTGGKIPLPGGVIHRSSGWIVEHCLGPLGVGTLIVKPERHIMHVADLRGDDATTMGRLILRATQVVTELCRPEQVYVSLWSHAGGEPGHIHYVIQPVSAADMERHGVHGPKLQAAMFANDNQPDPGVVDEFSARARAMWDQSTPTGIE